MPDKQRKTAPDLKLMIEEKLRTGHPDCERAELIIKPPADGGSWSAAIFGQPPLTGGAVQDKAANSYRQFLESRLVLLSWMRGLGPCQIRKIVATTPLNALAWPRRLRTVQRVRCF
jgi:hypothetical protein